jgi:hypothetical protein
VEVSDADALHDMAGLWLFHPGDNPAFARPQLDDRNWEERILPTIGSGWNDRWRGRAWYRLHINVEARALGQPFAISVGPAREVAEIFVNGNLIARRGSFGSRPRGGTRVLHLSGLVQAGVLTLGDNVIALRVYDSSWNGGLPTGPLLLGPPEQVRELVEPEGQLAMAARVSLGLLALCLGLAQMLTVFGRRASRENWWLVGAGVSAAVMLFDGTGVLTGLIPNLDLATRLPLVGGCVAVVCVASFFASRFDDWGARHVAIGRGILWVTAAILLLVHEMVVFWAGDAILLIVALVTALYGANQLSKAVRRQEQGAVAVFVSLLSMVLLLIYDGIWAAPASALPPFSALGGVGVLLVTGVIGARATMQEHERVLSEMLRLRALTKGHSQHSILDSTAMSITHPQEFLAAVIHEAARELEVRRCSLVLEDDKGVLRVAAGIGLPTAASSHVIPRDDSIAGWVFVHGDAVSSSALPAGFEERRRVEGYQSASFVCHPVKRGGAVLGVLNFSDRNDGAEFTASEEIAAAEVADKLALVLTGLGQRTSTRFGRRPQAVQPAIQMPTELPGNGEGPEESDDPER